MCAVFTFYLGNLITYKFKYLTFEEASKEIVVSANTFYQVTKNNT